MVHVIIAGAGIAGLAAGISLRRAGHSVTIYERSSMNEELGAAIHVPPNAWRFLSAWGLDATRWGFVRTRRVTFHDASSGEVKMQVAGEGHDRENGGTDLYYAHRVDLHNSLKWLATRPDGPGTPVVIHLKSRVVSYDPEAPSITLDDGQVITGDLVIGADGVHSLASETVLGRENKPVAPEHVNCCFRFLVTAEDLESDPEVRWYNQDRDGWLRLHSDMKTSRRFLSYPCRNNTIHNFVGLYYDNSLTEENREDWQATVDKQLVLDEYKDFSPKLLKLMAKATNIKRWPLLYRHPLPTWHKGRLVVLGDAAHPMLPHQGQGGAQGMEDGLCIGVVLNGAATANEIKKRLSIFESLRRNRTSAIQILSNVGQDQTHLVREELLKYIPEEKIPTSPQAIHRFTFGFDVVRDTIAAMKEHDPSFELPGDFFEREVPGVPEEVVKNGTNNVAKDRRSPRRLLADIKSQAVRTREITAPEAAEGKKARGGGSHAGGRLNAFKAAMVLRIRNVKKMLP